VEIGATVYAPDRAAWRRWLEANHRNAAEVWLVSYRKETGQPSIPYADAVEEALCVGWIDSTRKRLDDRRYAQRFTPRRPGSSYSQTNLERLRVLVAEGRLGRDMHAAVAPILEEPFVTPDDVVAALRQEPEAWANFQRYPVAYRRIRLAYVDEARGRPEEFSKRLRHLVRMTARDRRFGYGIERFYEAEAAVED
jgi:uncharacterized protein YdeI (YjbR/CyaY-like superfamily)